MAERRDVDPATLLTVLAVAAALAVRVRLCAWGLPYGVHWDEPQTAATALHMLQTGDPHPHFLRYGTLLTYLCVPVDALVAWWHFGRSAPPMLGHLSEATVDGWTWSHPAFLAANRLVVAVLGTVGVAAAAAHARVWGGAWAGLVAAVFLAFLPVDAEHAAIVAPNGPLSASVSICALATAFYLQSGSRAWLAGAFAAAGFAASFKYTGATVALLPALALGWRRDVPGAAAGLLLPACFLAGTPYALLDLPFFVNEVGTEIRHYRVLGHPGATVTPGVAHLAGSLSDLARELGPWRGLVLVGAALALPRAVRRPELWILAAFPAVYALFLAGWKVDFHRNWLPLYPLLAVAAGVGVAALGRAVPVVGAALVVATGAGAARLLPARPDPRTSMVEEVRLSGQRPGFPTELGLHPRDVARLPDGAEVAPLAELACGPARDLVIPARFASIGDADAAWRANHLLPGGPTDGPPRWLDGTSDAPLRIVPNRPPAPGCRALPLALDDFAGTKDFPRSDEAIFLVWDGALTATLSLPPGGYGVAWRLAGGPVAGAWPAWEARAGDAVARGTAEAGEAFLTFTAGEEPVTITLAFTNDFADATGDRNLEVHDVVLWGGISPPER